MLFRFEIVALAAALTLSSVQMAAACDLGASATDALAQSAALETETQVSDVSTERYHRPELTAEPGEAVTSQKADLDAFDPARFLQLENGEMFVLVAGSFAAPEDTTGSIVPLASEEDWALDGWEDR